MRAIALCLAAAFAVQATGALELLEAPPCCPGEDCPDENDEGRCSPSCATCAVAKVVQARVLPVLDAPTTTAEADRALPRALDAPPDGVHADVFHPPRA